MMFHREVELQNLFQVVQSNMRLIYSVLVDINSLINLYYQPYVSIQPEQVVAASVSLCCDLKFKLNALFIKLMSEEQSGANHEQIIKTKEEAERKFGCPCGKWYLSYPALFTHVKQKHQGKPPGALIKPKTDKARGRPRLPTNNADEDQSIANYDCVEQLQKAIMDKKIEYLGQYEFSDGTESCQDMASNFLRIMGGNGQEKKILTCFVNYIRYFVKQKYSETYWQTNKPTEIIDIANEIVRDLQYNKDAFPLDKELLIDLLYVLFRWMYKNKWTDHKLVRRNPENQAKV